MKRLLFEHDREAEAMFMERGRPRTVEFVSCQGVVEKRELMADMKQILANIQSEYDYPVDTEFTINLSETGEYVINLLQCRPLQVYHDSGDLNLPEDIAADKVIFECVHSAMGLSRLEKLDLVVFVDPVNYYNMPYKEKSRVAQAVGAVNWQMRGKDKKLLLMSPGRIGTSSPELGVPALFSDISEFDCICEIADSRSGYNPELSYGSHFFQDLVESGILYNAIFENDKTLTYDISRLDMSQNLLCEYAPSFADLSDIVKVIDVSGAGVMLCNDMKNERIICYLSQML